MAGHRLAGALSPFVRSHKDDPVNWFPWGAEAISLAAQSDRPLLLTIGASSSRSCRAMHRDSFSHTGAARLMNDRFVCVVADREEHPELEAFYLPAALAMNREGSSPLNVFMTPELSPFFAGSYLQPVDEEGRLGWLSLVGRIADLWERDRDELFRQGAELQEVIRGVHEVLPPRAINRGHFNQALVGLRAQYDASHGGFGSAGKFYHPSSLEFLLRAHLRTGDAQAAEMLTHTLDAFAASALRDPLGFGFARCSSDPEMESPQWERMLYDNAQLAMLYIDAGRHFVNPVYLEVARSTLDCLVEQFQRADGGFATALFPDEDREDFPGPWFDVRGVKVRDALTEQQLAAFSLRFGLGTGGATRARVLTEEEAASSLGQSAAVVRELLVAASARVQGLRDHSPRPRVDAKVVAAYHGLALKAVAVGTLVFGDERYRESARRAAAYLSSTLVSSGAVHRLGVDDRVGGQGGLEDYACCADGLVSLYEAVGDESYLRQAGDLLAQLLERFRGPGGALHARPTDEVLLLPFSPNESHDAALPSAGAVAARVLARAGRLSGRQPWVDAAVAALRAQGHRVARNPRAHVAVLNAAEALMVEPPGVALAASADVPAEERSPTELVQNTFDELAAPPLAGRATPAGTRTYFRSRALPSSATRTLGDGLVVSRLGFGGYRVDEDVLEHQRALALALAEGCNLIDTAPSYGQGSSERLVGAALAQQVQAGVLGRDQVVVMTKVGLSSEPLPALPAGAMALGDRASYCLHPEWLERSLGESLRRLGLVAVDVLLIHSPELLLSALPRTEALAMLQSALRWLETQRTAGRITTYGISCSLLGGTRGFELSELVAVVRAAGASGFGVLQLPLNPLETAALGNEEDSAAWVAGASAAGWAVVTHRPLNALHGDTLVRLADAPPDASAAAGFAAAREEVAKLEHEFRAQLGAVLLAVPDIKLPVGEFFSWADRVTDYELTSRELWDDFEREILSAHLPGMVMALNRAFIGKKLDSVWRSWRDRYTDAFERWVLAARARAAVATTSRNLPMRRELVAHAPEALRAASLSRLVLWNLTSLDDVTAVLVGMRSSAHVQDALGTIRWQEAAEPRVALDAAATALVKTLDGE